MGPDPCRDGLQGAEDPPHGKGALPLPASAPARQRRPLPRQGFLRWLAADQVRVFAGGRGPRPGNLAALTRVLRGGGLEPEADLTTRGPTARLRMPHPIPGTPARRAGSTPGRDWGRSSRCGWTWMTMGGVLKPHWPSQMFLYSAAPHPARSSDAAPPPILPPGQKERAWPTASKAGFLSDRVRSELGSGEPKSGRDPSEGAASCRSFRERPATTRSHSPRG